MYEPMGNGATGLLPPNTPPVPPRPTPPLPTGRARRGNPILNWISLAVSVMALICAVAALVLAWPEKEPEVIVEELPVPEIVEPEPEPVSYIYYRNREIPIQENVKINQVVDTGLGRDENGWLTYEWDGVEGIT